MTETDRPAFYEILDLANDLTIMPGGKDLERMKQVLFASLAEYPLRVVAEAVDAHCRASRYFPLLADIAAHIEGSIDERATVAWYQVLKAIKKYGLSRSIRFSTPATHFAIDRMCGWPSLCDMITDSNASYMLRDFKVFYRLGERYATWRNVCEYFPSDYERCELRMGRVPKRKVYDVESGHVVPEEMLSPIEPVAAWALVLRTKYRECWRVVKSVKFPDPAIHYAIERMGGWELFCLTLNDDTEGRKREEFRRCYMDYRAGEAIPEYLSAGDEGDVFDVQTERYIRLNALPEVREGGVLYEAR